VFAAVCVLLTSLGHVMMSGAGVPWWAIVAGAAVTGGTAWRLAGRERGPVLVGAFTVGAQVVLHVSFSLAQASQGHAMGGMHSMGSMESMDHAGAAHSLDHGIGGMYSTSMSSTGMLAAHLLAALLCGIWLAHGERAAFRILRALVGRLVAPLRLILRPPAPPHRPRIRSRRARTGHGLRQLLLTHAITTRGPPAGTAVA
jgi:hypothetical protein